MPWVTPTSVSTGDVLTAARYNSDVVGNAAELAPLFATWTTFTPTIAQGVATNIAKTTVYSKYVRVGKLIIWQFDLALTGAGTSASGFTLSIPVNFASSMNSISGIGVVVDASTSTTYSGGWLVISNLLYFVGDWAGVNTWGANPSIALASGDTIRGTVTYEVA